MSRLLSGIGASVVVVLTGIGLWALDYYWQAKLILFGVLLLFGAGVLWWIIYLLLRDLLEKESPDGE